MTAESARRRQPSKPHSRSSRERSNVMAGRGPQTFKKRQKEQQRKEKQQEKAAKREQRKVDRPEGSGPEIDFDFSMHDDEVNAEEIADRLVGRTLADG
jgi:hypothetical protein